MGDEVHFEMESLAPWGGIAAGMREALLEAARVMLDACHTQRPARGTWRHNAETMPMLVSWAPADETMRRTHGNAKDATEDGAYALAVYAVTRLGFQVLGRAPQGTGADWYMVHAEAPNAMLKLEVSGIERGGSPGHRLREKVAQGRDGALPAPGVAVVFRFADAACHSESWR